MRDEKGNWYGGPVCKECGRRMTILEWRNQKICRLCRGLPKFPEDDELGS